MKLSVVILSVAIAGLALSQVQQVQGPLKISMPPARPPVLLAVKPEIQRELSLSQAQKDAVRKAVGAGGLSTPEQFEGAYAKVKSALRPGQVERLEQIHRRRTGLYAATYPPYAKALRLQPAQVQKILSTYSAIVSSQLQSQMAAAGRPGGGPIRMTVKPEDDKKAQQMLEAKCRPVLTPAQWAKWRAMLGKPQGAKGAAR